MGQYTELIFGAKFGKDTPREIIDTLRYLAGQLEQPPTEGLLWSNNCRNPLQGGSYYFGITQSVTQMDYDEYTGKW